MNSAACPICRTASPFAGIKNSFAVYRCAKCSHLFVFPAPEAPLDLYSEQYFAGGKNGFGYVDYDRDKEPTVSSFNRYLDLIGHYASKPTALFDVGAATGFFLELARLRGWQVSGVEPSDYAAAIARGKGIDVATGVLEKPVGPFQVITALDVVEHIPDAREFIRTARSSLCPGGILAINTPDSSSVVARLLGVHWHAVLPPEHVQLFSRQSLGMLLEQEGFQVLTTAWIGKTFTLQYIFRTLARWQKLSLWSSISNGLKGKASGQIAVPLNLHDNLFVLARKSR